MAVPVSVVLARKGSDVATIRSSATLSEAAQELARRRIGALVVSDDGVRVAGVISERDVVRVIALDGAAALDRPVGQLMTRDVATCSPATSTDELMTLMTEQRFRHVPVLDNGALAGIVSIGDVVKSRIDELHIESQALREYVTGSY